MYTYKTKNKAGKAEEKSFAFRDFRLDECPVSFLSAQRDGRQPFITGARATRLVRLWQKTERRKSTLTEALDTDEAWIEDVEDLLANTQEAVKEAYEKDRDKRISLG